MNWFQRLTKALAALLSRAAEEVRKCFLRFIENEPSNEYEVIVFAAMRDIIVRIGRI